MYKGRKKEEREKKGKGRKKVGLEEKGVEKRVKGEIKGKET